MMLGHYIYLPYTIEIHNHDTEDQTQASVNMCTITNWSCNDCPEDLGTSTQECNKPFGCSKIKTRNK